MFVFPARQEPPVCVTCQKPLQIGTRLDCGQGHIFCPQHAPPDLVREKICPACKGQFTSSTFHHFEGIGGQALPRLALPPSPPEEGHIESGEKADSEPEPEASESDSEDTPPPSLGGTPPRSSPPRTRQAAAARNQRSIRVSGSADASTPAQQIGVATPPSAGTAATTATHHPLHETAAPAPQTAEPPRRLESTDTAAPSAAASSSAGTPAHQRTGNPGKRPMNASGSTRTPSAPSTSANSVQPQAKQQRMVRAARRSLISTHH